MNFRMNKRPKYDLEADKIKKQSMLSCRIGKKDRRRLATVLMLNRKGRISLAGDRSRFHLNLL